MLTNRAALPTLPGGDVRPGGGEAGWERLLAAFSGPSDRATTSATPSSPADMPCSGPSGRSINAETGMGSVHLGNVGLDVVRSKFPRAVLRTT
jgi:hypothetical protein